VPAFGDAVEAAPDGGVGVTVIVLSYERMNGLAALLESLLEQDLRRRQLELIVCNNSLRYHLKQSRLSRIGRLLSQFRLVKVFNSSHNWRDQVRYGLGTLAAYDKIMFIDDDIVILDRNFVHKMFQAHNSLRPVDILSCWNTIWTSWNDEFFTDVSLTFATSEISELTQTDTIGTGICMFNKQVLFTSRIMEMFKDYRNAYDMAFPLVANLVWGSRGYFFPCYGMLKMHPDSSVHSLCAVPGHYDERYSLFKKLLQEGYRPVISEDSDRFERESPEHRAVRVLPAVKHAWK
jgi:glycosyltransferase involved in cell wall biosynthesis